MFQFVAGIALGSFITFAALHPGAAKDVSAKTINSIHTIASDFGVQNPTTQAIPQQISPKNAPKKAENAEQKVVDK